LVRWARLSLGRLAISDCNQLCMFDIWVYRRIWAMQTCRLLLFLALISYYGMFILYA
jgi:hypothetical protein